MGLTPQQMPESAVPQFWDSVVHAAVIALCIVAACVMGALHIIHENTVGNVLTAAIGYAAGRAGSVVHRTISARKSDTTRTGPTIDSTG